MRDYIEGTDISGIEPPDDTTVVFTLTKPASDFPFMLSLDAADPAPIEALDNLPDSPEYRRAFVSSGPYQVAWTCQSRALRYSPPRLRRTLPRTQVPAAGPGVSGGSTSGGVVEKHATHASPKQAAANPDRFMRVMPGR